MPSKVLYNTKNKASLHAKPLAKMTGVVAGRLVEVILHHGFVVFQVVSVFVWLPFFLGWWTCFFIGITRIQLVFEIAIENLLDSLPILLSYPAYE